MRPILQEFNMESSFEFLHRFYMANKTRQKKRGEKKSQTHSKHLPYARCIDCYSKSIISLGAHDCCHFIIIFAHSIASQSFFISFGYLCVCIFILFTCNFANKRTIDYNPLLQFQNIEFIARTLEDRRSLVGIFMCVLVLTMLLMLLLC